MADQTLPLLRSDQLKNICALIRLEETLVIFDNASAEPAPKKDLMYSPDLKAF